MSTTERPTMPPSAADEQADKFAAKLARIERQRDARTASGLFRALAEAYAETKTPSGA